MRIAYLILAHDHPSQLKRLTNALDDFDDHIFIHVNKKSDIRLFSDVAQQPHVSLIPHRIPVHWGGFSMADATINLLRNAREHPSPFDYYSFLSGSDYPIRSNAYIHSYFEEHQHCEFINMVDAMRKEKCHLLSRLQYFTFERGLTRHPLFHALRDRLTTPNLRFTLFTDCLLPFNAANRLLLCDLRGLMALEIS